MGERRTLRAVARFADEWNGVNLSPNAYASKRAVLERHCEAADRDPTEIRHSMMTFGLVGPTPAHIDAAAVHQAYAIARGESLSPSALQERARAMGVIVGGAEEVVDQLGRLADLGMHEVLFRHLHWDSDEIPQYLAHEIAPKVAGPLSDRPAREEAHERQRVSQPLHRLAEPELLRCPRGPQRRAVALSPQ